MRYNEWIEGIKNPFGKPSDKLTAIGVALLKFNKTGFELDLKEVRDALARLSEPAEKPLLAKIQKAVDRLSIWTNTRLLMFDEDKRTAIPLLSKAATTVNEAYGHYMPEEYRAALQQNFIANQGHVYCYKCYASEGKWVSRRDKLTGGMDITKIGSINAATPTISNATMNFDFGEHGSRNLKNDSPPNNRRIEFHTMSDHTAVHEMLHWCCHEEFRRTAHAGVLGADYEFVLEGFTEWLASHALNTSWPLDTYAMIRGAVIDCVEKGHPDLDSMAAAYFKGTRVNEVAKDMLDHVREYKNAQLRGPVVSEGEMNDILAVMSRRTVQAASEDFKKRAKAGFRGIDKDTAKTKLKDIRDRKAWLEFLDAEGVLT